MTGQARGLGPHPAPGHKAPADLPSWEHVCGSQALLHKRHATACRWGRLVSASLPWPCSHHCRRAHTQWRKRCKHSLRRRRCRSCQPWCTARTMMEQASLLGRDMLGCMLDDACLQLPVLGKRPGMPCRSETANLLAHPTRAWMRGATDCASSSTQLLTHLRLPVLSALLLSQAVQVAQLAPYAEQSVMPVHCSVGLVG